MILAVKLPFMSIKKLATALIALLTLCSLPSTSHARVGESRNELEGRLLQDRTAVKVPSRQVEALLMHRTVPYRWIYEYLPSGSEHELYYKPADDNRASTTDLDVEFPDGWMLHVIYYKGQSVFEAYRRNGSAMSSFEEEGILMRHKNGSHWSRVGERGVTDSAIGYNFERADSGLRALKRGEYLILYRPEFDLGIKKQADEAQAEAEALAKENAPDSLQGF